VDPYIGEIRIFAGNFAPKDWALCNGQLMAIVQNTALFSILGTNYGGDGKTTFGLPNLQAATPMSQGSGPGLTPRQVGEVGGSPTVTLTAAQLPGHSHTFGVELGLGDQTAVANNFVAANRNASAFTAPNAPNLNTQPMNAAAIANSGGSQPHNNRQPFLGLTFIICLNGIYPPRS
jgi:microcystin-dependent protein